MHGLFKKVTKKQKPLKNKTTLSDNKSSAINYHLDGFIDGSIQGWAENTEKVKIFLNDDFISEVSCSIYRKDLERIISNPTSGFSYVLNESSIKNDWFKKTKLNIRVEFIDANKETIATSECIVESQAIRNHFNSKKQLSTKLFNFNPADLTSSLENSITYCIDFHGYIEKETYFVRGWAVDRYGKPVNISLKKSDKDNEYKLKIHQEKRDDVLEVIKNKKIEPNIGFFITSNVSPSQEELKINLRSEDDSLDISLHGQTHHSEDLFKIYNDIISEVTLKNKNDSISTTTDQHKKNNIDDLMANTPNEKPTNLLPEPLAYYIEKIGYCGEKVGVLRGWVINKEDVNKKVDIELYSGNKKLELIENHTISRDDVLTSLGLESNIESGFSILFNLENTESKNIQIKLKSSTYNKTINHKITPLDYSELEYALIDVKNIDIQEAKKRLIQHLGSNYLDFITKNSQSLESINCKIHFDYQLLTENGGFIAGWLLTDPELESIYFTNGESISNNLLDSIARYPRPDVNKAFNINIGIECGFYTYMDLNPSYEKDGLIFVTKKGKCVYVDLNQGKVSKNVLASTKEILTYFNTEGIFNNNQLKVHFHPVLQDIWKNQTKLPSNKKTKITEYGKPIDNPSCSIIIPLYGRYDFVLHQIVSFSQDPSFEKFEIIYVNDDPTIENELHLLCQDIEQLYSLPFKVISYARNLGYAGANNVGVQHANSEQLLLLNSDILPKTQGWLSNMLDVYKAQKNIGALGIKLVFDDETIQHIGMDFVKSKQFGNLWLNEHPFKGFPNNLTPSFDLKPSPTVTAACLMVSREKFNEVGGFDTSFILGDFEDSDLCLKLLSKGYTNYVSGKDYLYHLERQSQSLVEPGDWKFKLTLYNGWQHTNRWDKTIKELTEKTV